MGVECMFMSECMCMDMQKHICIGEYVGMVYGANCILYSV